MNFAWLKTVFSVLTNEAVMEPIIAAILGYGVNIYAKNRRYKIILDITADVIDYIDQNYKDWGLDENEKMDKFMEIFKKEYKKHFGRMPKTDDIESAMIRANAISYRNRKK